MRLISAEMYHHTVGDNPDALSVKKGTDWERDHHYLLSRVCSVVDSLENTFGVSLMKFRCLLCESRLNKYLSSLGTQPYSAVKEGLRHPLKDRCLDVLWNDRKNMNKGERRHIFDFLAKAGATGLLALYVKYFRAEY